MSPPSKILSSFENNTLQVKKGNIFLKKLSNQTATPIYDFSHSLSS